MKQKGRVLAVDNGIASVEVVRASACSGECGSCGGCAHTSQRIIVKIPCTTVKVGEVVSIRMKSSKVLFLAQLTYIFPLIFLLAGYGIASPYGENMGILCGFAGFALSLPIVFFAAKKAKKMLQYDIELE